jgi:hypothetical protein
MTSPADIIRELIGDLGHTDIGIPATWPAYVSFLPDFPAEAVAVYDSIGVQDGRLMSGIKIEHDGIQIILRSPEYQDGWNKANDIALALDIQNNVSVDVESDTSYIVVNVSRIGTINAAGVDEKDGQRRHYFTINAKVTYRVSS